MRRVILIRHAKSDWGNPDLNDFERPLNGRGKKAAPLMGQYLASGPWIPDYLASSPAKRARKTARLIAAELDFDKGAIVYQDSIYDARVAVLQNVLKGLPDVACPALIGHNPGLSELGQWLCPDAPGWLKTAAVLILQLEIESWSEVRPGCATLLDYSYPKKVMAEQ